MIDKGDAETISSVLCEADGGCICCAMELAEEMAKVFPEHDWVSLVRKAGEWEDLDA